MPCFYEDKIPDAADAAAKAARCFSSCCWTSKEVLRLTLGLVRDEKLGDPGRDPVEVKDPVLPCCEERPEGGIDVE